MSTIGWSGSGRLAERLSECDIGAPSRTQVEPVDARRRGSLPESTIGGSRPADSRAKPM
jgi:hypothetical protein